jgi:DNA-binding XRE family transcriptional regulator
MIGIQPGTERISPAQVRAARAWLGWSQAELAKASLVGRKTIAEFEAQTSFPYERTLRDMRVALETAGIIFIFEDGSPVGIKSAR